MNSTCCCGYLPYNVLNRISEVEDLELIQNLLEQREIALEEAIEVEELVPQYEASFFSRASRKLSSGDNKKKKVNKSNNVTPITTPRSNDKKQYLASSSSNTNSPRIITNVKSKRKSIPNSFKIISKGKSKDIERKLKSETISHSSCSSELDDDSPGRGRKFVFTMSKSSSPKSSSSNSEHLEPHAEDQLYVSEPLPSTYMSPRKDKVNVDFQMDVEGDPSTSKKKEK